MAVRIILFFVALSVGMAQGMAQANRNNAMKMKADGMSADLIAKYTGLTTLLYI